MFEVKILGKSGCVQHHFSKKKTTTVTVKVISSYIFELDFFHRLLCVLMIVGACVLTAYLHTF